MRRLSYEFHCRDVGAECNGVLSAPQPDELVQKVAGHLRDKHGLKVIPQSIVNLALTVVRQT